MATPPNTLLTSARMITTHLTTRCPSYGERSTVTLRRMNPLAFPRHTLRTAITARMTTRFRNFATEPHGTTTRPPPLRLTPSRPYGSETSEITTRHHRLRQTIRDGIVIVTRNVASTPCDFTKLGQPMHPEHQVWHRTLRARNRPRITMRRIPPASHLTASRHIIVNTNAVVRSLTGGLMAALPDPRCDT